MARLFIYGFPGLYGGASTELHHQIYVWLKMPELELHIIPTQAGYERDHLYQEMLDLGVTIHKQHNFSVVKPEDAIINFCSSAFLDNVSHINQFTKRTIFVNCMTWIFNDKKEHVYDEIGAHMRNQIAFSLYQRPQIRDENEKILREFGSKAEFIHFIPYFNESGWDFLVKDQEKVHIGRISRDATDKYTSTNPYIYEGVHSPKLKEGHWLGFAGNGKSVTGEPQKWIKTYWNQTQLPVKDFYKQVDFILQPTRTTENWPRIGFEAMFSGCPLVVDNRGGWQYMIEHGVDGFLCNTPSDFMYYGSRLAYDFELRNKIAENARRKARQLGGFEQSRESWRGIFERVFN
jgi:hypothetical protein